MTPERWGQLEELYQAARDLPPPERTALLERADLQLRATVASLLAQGEDGGFLDRPAWEGRQSLLIGSPRETNIKRAKRGQGKEVIWTAPSHRGACREMAHQER
ncbi:MAG TPA: hypothetical protein VLY24_30070 [Bryobacteraceae bacterium]|nr:hypothetical protein [Bryobacteraceae bacterium]